MRKVSRNSMCIVLDLLLNEKPKWTSCYNADFIIFGNGSFVEFNSKFHLLVGIFNYLGNIAEKLFAILTTNLTMSSRLLYKILHEQTLLSLIIEKETNKKRNKNKTRTLPMLFRKCSIYCFILGMIETTSVRGASILVLWGCRIFYWHYSQVHSDLLW